MFTRRFAFWILAAAAFAIADAGRNVAPSTTVLHAQSESATLAFTDITAAAGIDEQTSGSHGAMFADADGDGAPDLYVTYNHINFGFRQHRFYRNGGGGAFAEEAAFRGIDNFSGGGHGAVWADLDNDGDYDLVLGNTYGGTGSVPPPAANRMFRNDGGRFVDITPPAMAGYADYTRGMNVLDIDRDGDLDVFAVNGYLGDFEPIPDRNELYRNDGGMQFSAITSGAAITIPAGQGAVDTDYDGDGDVDLIAANQNGRLAVLRNDGGGALTAVPPEAIGIGRRAATGITSGDLDNDGDLDLILVDVSGSLRVGYFYRNDGGTFSFLGETPRFGGYTAGLADLDNDGDVDLVLPGYPIVLLNDGTGRFVGGPGVPGPGVDADPRTVAFADIDGDGDLDFFVTAKLGSPALVRNDLNAGAWLKVRLISPQAQAGAFGARVRVRFPGSAVLIGSREARSNLGYLAQDDPVLHAGLGNAPAVDVEVTFLDGTRVTRSGVSANQTLTIGADSSVALPTAPRNLAASIAGASVTLTWDAPVGGGAPAEYVIEAGSAPSASNLAIVRTGSVLRSFSAFAPPGTYSVRGKARNGAGIGPASNEIVVVVGGAAAPNAPVGLTFTQTGNQVTLRWAPPPQGQPPSSYLLEVGSRAGTSDLLVFDNGLSTTLSAIASPGTYFVRVRSRNAGGMSPPSNEVVIQVSDLR